MLPLGISFFSFQAIAYLVDIATGEEPLHNLSEFLLFKSFWPQLIAGPIIRIDQMRKQRSQAGELARTATLFDSVHGFVEQQQKRANSGMHCSICSLGTWA